MSSQKSCNAAMLQTHKFRSDYTHACLYGLPYKLQVASKQCRARSPFLQIRSAVLCVLPSPFVDHMVCLAKRHITRKTSTCEIGTEEGKEIPKIHSFIFTLHTSSAGISISKMHYLYQSTCFVYISSNFTNRYTLNAAYRVDIDQLH